jgi:hypothetical protein
LDNVVISADKRSGKETVIGNDVIVSPGAVIRGATIGDGTMIGMGAVVMPGARIGSDCFIDGGSVVPANAVVPAGQLWTGKPARLLRTLTQDEMAYMRSTALEYGRLSQLHFEQGNKSTAELEAEKELMMYKIEKGMKPEEAIPQTSADVLEYYKLTATKENFGLFREIEFDNAAEAAAAEKEEMRADALETQRYEALARMKRVGAVLLQLTAARPGQGHAVLSDLAALDPEGAAMVAEFLSKVRGAEETQDAEAKARLVGVLASFRDATSSSEPADVEAEAKEDFQRLLPHAVNLGSPEKPKLQ